MHRETPMRILSILARHGREAHPGALDDLRAYHRACLPSARCDLLVVDNADPGAPRPGEPETIAGSGRSREFSAWDEGIAHAGLRLWDYDLVHLVTSAFRALYTRYLDRCDERTLALAAGRGLAVGHVDYYDQPVELLGCRSQCWLRSSFVFLPPSELLALGPLAALRESGRFFSGDPAAPFREDAPLSAQYRRYILDWLTGAGTGQGTTWHSRFGLDAATLPTFEAKALAILHEHLFTIRLRRQGCAVADATWLATRAARGARPGAALPIPGWRDQLAGRDTDAIPLARTG